MRKLLTQEFQHENETLNKLKAVSFDFQFAKAEAYYYQRYREMLMEKALYQEVVPEREIRIEEDKKSQSKNSEGAKKWNYLVSERELKHIEKHIHKAAQARSLRDHTYQLLPQRTPNKIPFPKILTMEDEKNEYVQKIHKTEPKKHKVAWAKEQIKGHQGRMIRGRKIKEQRNDQRDAKKPSRHVPPSLKSQVEKEERKEFERVTTYPIFQPYPKQRIEVSILMEKSKENKIQKPLQRELLCVPPFLRSQLEKK